MGLISATASLAAPADDLRRLVEQCDATGTDHEMCEAKLWDFADVTGDGLLTIAEVNRFLQLGNADLPLLDLLGGPYLFANYDYDGDERLSHAELSDGTGLLSIARRLMRQAASQAKEEASVDSGHAPSQRRDMERPIPGTSVDRPLTMSEIDAIRYQIEQCWSVPAGARDAEDMIVRIRVFLNPDGTLSKPPEIVDEAHGSDSFYRTAAESARRAVLQCAPLKNLPANKYKLWRELTLTFNPRQMLGG